jgi:ribosomal-protein-alanine N-acetyltransferase
MNETDPTLSTDRLQLRLLTNADLEAVWPGVSDPEVSENMSWSAHRNKEETRIFLERIETDFAAGKGITWAVRTAGEFCGIFSIISILRRHRALRYDRGELAYWCLPKHQGKGIMSEAGRSVIAYAFGPLGLNRLVVAHHLENVASRKLIERLGFRAIGTEHEAFMKNGRWIDTKIYELLAKDYKFPC